MLEDVRAAEFNDRRPVKLVVRDAHALEPVDRRVFEVLAMQILLEVGSVCSSNAAESGASMAGLSLPSSDGVTCSGSRAKAVAGSIS